MWYECMNCQHKFEWKQDVMDGRRCPKCKGKIVLIPPPIKNTQYEISKLDVKNGDVIVVTVNALLSQKHVDAIAKYIKESIRKDIDVLVIHSGIEIVEANKR